MNQQNGAENRRTVGWLLLILGFLMLGCFFFDLCSAFGTIGGSTTLGRVELTILALLGVILVSVGIGFAAGKRRQPK